MNGTTRPDTVKPASGARALLLLAAAIALVPGARGQESAVSGPGSDQASLYIALFVDRARDTDDSHDQLAAMLARAAARVGGKVQAQDEGSRTRGFRVLLPSEASRADFVQALAADPECTTSAESCRAHCRLIAGLDGTWHVHLKSPVEGRHCLAVFTSDAQVLGELEPRVLGTPREYGFRRKPRIGRVRITFGRPEFPSR